MKNLLSFALGILVSMGAINLTESETLTQAITSIYIILSNG